MTKWSKWCHGMLRYPECIPINFSWLVLTYISKHWQTSFGFILSQFNFGSLLNRFNLFRWQTVVWGHFWKSLFFWFMLYIGWVDQTWQLASINHHWSDMRPVPDVSVTLVPAGQQIKGHISQPCRGSRYHISNSGGCSLISSQERICSGCSVSVSSSWALWCWGWVWLGCAGRSAPAGAGCRWWERHLSFVSDPWGKTLLISSLSHLCWCCWPLSVWAAWWY